MKPHLVAMPQVAVQLATASPLYLSGSKFRTGSCGTVGMLVQRDSIRTCLCSSSQEHACIGHESISVHKRAELGGRGGCYSSSRGSVSYLGLVRTCNRIVCPYGAFHWTYRHMDHDEFMPEDSVARPESDHETEETTVADERR
jgi:hypothetical protein